MVIGEGRRVSYLIGAGASQGCVDSVGSEHGILMSHLNQELSDEAGDLLEESQYESREELKLLVNEIVTEDMDFEQVITFLDNSPSAIHRSFADDLRTKFEYVIKNKLRNIKDEFGGRETKLYKVLLDIHEHPSSNEELVGIMTLNYDQYIERAIEDFPEHCVDFGVEVRGTECDDSPIMLLKLHGSFGWEETWPITTNNGESSLWIPPGIQKAKDRYPFNVIWGRAREMLDCDVLRIIGCGLGPNDWDLISLLFSTRHANVQGEPYSIEVIDSPKRTESMTNDFPYLELRSLLQLDDIGQNIVSEILGGSPRPYDSLSEDEKDRLMKKTEKRSNWFQIWLTQMAELITENHGTIETPNEHLKAFYEEA
ncbi:hypothetical protein BRC75_06360 [Halobacteriales archaeon QH_7_69_31]|nr:MAG: hypothetical protein BRC75_06360 [Halobacteriales archaeon QH_7_69_31]